jgi:hypothetical protein
LSSTGAAFFKYIGIKINVVMFYFQINFARFCAYENCSADLQVSAKVGFLK